MKGLGDLSHSLQLWFWKKETMQIGVWQRHLALDCLISIFNGLIVINILWFIKAIYELFCVIFLPHKSPKKWGGSCGCVWAKGALISLRPGSRWVNSITSYFNIKIISTWVEFFYLRCSKGFVVIKPLKHLPPAIRSSGGISREDKHARDPEMGTPQQGGRTRTGWLEGGGRRLGATKILLLEELNGTSSTTFLTEIGHSLRSLGDFSWVSHFLLRKPLYP